MKCSDAEARNFLFAQALAGDKKAASKYWRALTYNEKCECVSGSVKIGKTRKPHIRCRVRK